jgi:hypothetical protein
MFSKDILFLNSQLVNQLANQLVTKNPHYNPNNQRLFVSLPITEMGSGPVVKMKAFTSNSGYP